MPRKLLSILVGCAAIQASAQLNVNTALTPEELVQDILVGSGVSVSNVTFNGAGATTPQDGSGSFTNGNSTNLGLDAGLILSSGLATSVVGPATNFGSDQLYTGSDPDLLAITTPGNTILDKAVLEFDFVPTGDSLKFSYVFGSEEYPSFNCSANFNDVFGFFLSGPGINGPYTNNAINIALVPGTNLPVSIANIHGSDGFSCPAANEQYYVYNTGGTTIALNGFTTVLRAEAAVTCGETYHIKLAIGDAGDMAYNSAVFLQAGSFRSNAVPQVNAATFHGSGATAEGCEGDYFAFFRPAGADSTVVVNFFLTGTATPGVDFQIPPSPAIIPAGQDSVVIPITAVEDGVIEGPESIIMNVFEINACGDTIINSSIMAIIDYPEIVIHTEPHLLLNCDQDSIPLYAYTSGGLGQVVLTWGDSLHANEVYVPGMENGTYTVSATDECPRSVAMEVVVDAGCQVIIPNVITPNGDGMNDRFHIDGIAGRENFVQIWNRWGQEVFSASNYQNNFFAKDLSDGTYFYFVRVLDKEYTGNLHVLGNARK